MKDHVLRVFIVAAIAGALVVFFAAPF